MCGIAGVLRSRGEADDTTAVRAVLDALAARGPDGDGLERDGPLTARSPPARDPRSERGRPPADAQRERPLRRQLQRRDLQLRGPRARARARPRSRCARRPTPRSCCTPGSAGARPRSIAWSGSGRSRSTTRRAAPVAGARPLRREAALLSPRTIGAQLRVDHAGAAAPALGRRAASIAGARRVLDAALRGRARAPSSHGVAQAARRGHLLGRRRAAASRSSAGTGRTSAPPARRRRAAARTSSPRSSARCSRRRRGAAW